MGTAASMQPRDHKLCGEPMMRNDKKHRVAGAIGFVVTALVLLSWIIAGFGSLDVAWQLGLALPLILVLIDYALAMFGREGVFAAVARFKRTRNQR
jgi:uncharacterized membrane protein